MLCLSAAISRKKFFQNEKYDQLTMTNLTLLCTIEILIYCAYEIPLKLCASIACEIYVYDSNQ